MDISIIHKSIILTFMMGLFCGCTKPAINTPTTMPLATYTALPTYTPYPTLRPLATYTPLPTYTPYPISTPKIIIREIPHKGEKDYWNSEPLSRDFYHDYHVQTNPSWFQQVYLEALVNGDAWIKDPLVVALRYAGYPNIDKIEPSKIFVFSISGTKVIIIKGDNLMDDSILDDEIRVDLIKIDDVWKVDWAGYRQRCQRSSFHGWTTESCP